MKSKNILFDIVMAFFISTTLITIGSGIIGSIFLKEVTFGYSVFLGPPLIGLLSSFLSIISYSKKELSTAQIMVRRGLHLLMIEMMVFGLNYFAGAVFELWFALILATFIMLVFIAVYVIIWLNDKRVAEEFNKELEIFQRRYE